MEQTGERSAFSPKLAESAIKAAFGAEELLAMVVTQLAWAPLTTVLLQPEGSDGVATESKFSDSGVAGARTPRGNLEDMGARLDTPPRARHRRRRGPPHTHLP